MKSLKTYTVFLISIYMAPGPAIINSEESIQLDEIVITGESIEDTARPNSKLKGDSLKSRTSNTLGETLSEEPGVQNASFGPGVGVPVIRGLSGSRVKTLSNNSGVHDASSTSPDHAVTVEPLLAEEIEVLRGPAVVRYGSGAMGGAVNVKDRRIPTEVPLDIFEGSTELRYGTNGAEKAVAAHATTGKKNVAFHINGFRRSRNNMEISGGALDEEAIFKQFGSSVDVVNAQGRIPNTDSVSSGSTIGGAFIGSKGMIGASFQKLDNEYGVPSGGHGLGTHMDPDGTIHGGPVRLDMDQSRIDSRAEWTQRLGWINSILLEFTQSDYEHEEAESGNHHGTAFKNDANEARLETSWDQNALKGSFGLHGLDRDFSAVGDESFIPPSNTVMGAAYLIQKLNVHPFSFEASARIENQRTDPDNEFHPATALDLVKLPNEYSFTPKSVALALDLNLSQDLKASFLVNWADRAPDVQELLSLGPHLATRSYEIGSVSLEEETSRQVDVGFSYSNDLIRIKANAYRNNIANYIYLENRATFYQLEKRTIQPLCNNLNTCLPVFGYEQANAKMEGGEAEVEVTVINNPKLQLSTRFFTDFVRGKFEDAALGDLPRLPPWRYGVALEANRNQTKGSIRWARSERQDRPGLNETETPGHSVLSAQLERKWPWKEIREVVLFINGKNLTNEEIRNSVSFLRNFSPESGRSIEMGLRLIF